jgi:hypothetical protein
MATGADVGPAEVFALYRDEIARASTMSPAHRTSRDSSPSGHADTPDTPCTRSRRRTPRSYRVGGLPGALRQVPRREPRTIPRPSW